MKGWIISKEQGLYLYEIHKFSYVLSSCMCVYVCALACFSEFLKQCKDKILMGEEILSVPKDLA